MADRFTISGSFFGTASWNDPSIWYGGIVPTSSDNVFIRGILKDIYGTSNDTNWQSDQFNSPLQYWPGTMSALLLGDNFGLPSSGSIYTYTDRNVEVKIDYNGTSGSRAILNCVIDKEFSAPWGQVSASTYNSNTEYPFPDKRGGYIPYRALTIFRPGIISISGSQTGSAFQLTIEDGGQVKVNSLGKLLIANSTDVQEGTLELRDYASYVWNNVYPYSSSITATSQPISASYLNISNNQFSKVIFEADEVRTNTTLSLSSNVGDYYLSVVSASNFEAGDYIFVGEEDVPTTREDDNTLTILQQAGGTNTPTNGIFTNGTQYGFNIPTDDECFYVTSKDTGSTPNRLYIQLQNGLQSKILLTSSATELVVDEERYQVGDKVLIGTQYRTVTAVEDYDFLLKDYDFLNPSTSLAEWETDASRSPYLDGWGIIPGIGLTLNYAPSSSDANTRLARYTFIKNLLPTRVKVDAWLRNNIPFSGGLSPLGFRDVNSYGVVVHQDPFHDFVARNIPGDNEGVNQARTVLSISPSGSTALLSVKSGGTSYGQKPILAGIQDIEGLHKLTIEVYKGFTKGYIDDIKLFEDINKNGVFWGRVGLISLNPRMICTRFRVYNKCQKITLNSPVTASINQIIYESGVEYPHSMGSKVIKLASVVNEVDNSLKNKAFAYQGADEYENNGAFPYIHSINTDSLNQVKNGGLYGNQQWGYGGYVLSDQGGGTMISPSFSTNSRIFSASVVIDLSQTMSFNNFGFIDYMISLGQNMTSSVGNGISLSGSNDPAGQIWTPITGGILDRRGRHDYQTIREWDLSSVQNYRLVRFQFNHLTNAAQYYTGISSFVLRSGSAFNQITVNNASDFNIGDKIGIYPNRTAAVPTNQRNILDQYLVSGSSSILNNTTDDFFTVIGKSGNTLTVDRKINLLVKKGTFVVKLNRNVNFVGSFTSGSSVRTGRIWGTHSNNFCNAFIFKNIGFQHINDGYPYLGNETYGMFSFNYTNFWKPAVFQGCSFYNTLSAGTGYWQSSQYPKSHYQSRHNILHGMYALGTMKPYNYQNAASLPCIIAGNIFIGTGGQQAVQNMNTQVVSSYNQYFYTDDIAGPLFDTSRQYADRLFGGYLRVERNTYKQCYTPFSMGAYGTYQQNLANANLGTYVFKNNKIESIAIYPYGGTSYTNYVPMVIGNSMFPAIGQNHYYANNFMENILLPDRGGWDGSMPSMFNGAQGLTYFANVRAVASFPRKNFNKYGQDQWTTAVGWVVKDPSESFYRFYNFSSSLYYGNNPSLYKSPFIDAQVAIFDNTTASFNLSFDYYHDMTQYINQWGGFTIDENNGFIQYDFIPQTGGLAPYTYSQSIFIPTSQSFAGSLAVSVYKNGKLIKPTTKIKKTLTPTNYNETFLLEGKGIYSITLGQDFTPMGYVALRNITSTINTPLTSSVDIRHNGFSMKYFEGLNSLQFRNINNQYPNTGGKFRLKGAKMF